MARERKNYVSERGARELFEYAGASRVSKPALEYVDEIIHAHVKDIVDKGKKGKIRQITGARLGPIYRQLTNQAYVDPSRDRPVPIFVLSPSQVLKAAQNNVSTSKKEQARFDVTEGGLYYFIKILEHQIMIRLRAAVTLAVFAGRQTVMKKDLEFVPATCRNFTPTTKEGWLLPEGADKEFASKVEARTIKRWKKNLGEAQAEEKRKEKEAAILKRAELADKRDRILKRRQIFGTEREDFEQWGQEGLDLDSSDDEDELSTLFAEEKMLMMPQARPLLQAVPDAEPGDEDEPLPPVKRKSKKKKRRKNRTQNLPKKRREDPNRQVPATASRKKKRIAEDEEEGVYDDDEDRPRKEKATARKTKKRIAEDEEAKVDDYEEELYLEFAKVAAREDLPNPRSHWNEAKERGAILEKLRKGDDKEKKSKTDKINRELPKKYTKPLLRALRPAEKIGEKQAALVLEKEPTKKKAKQAAQVPAKKPTKKKATASKYVPPYEQWTSFVEKAKAKGEMLPEGETPDSVWEHAKELGRRRELLSWHPTENHLFDLQSMDKELETEYGPKFARALHFAEVMGQEIGMKERKTKEDKHPKPTKPRKAKGKATSQKKGEEKEESVAKLKKKLKRVAEEEGELFGKDETPEEMWKNAIERGRILEGLEASLNLEDKYKQADVEAEWNNYSPPVRKALLPAEKIGREQAKKAKAKGKAQKKTKEKPAKKKTNNKATTKTKAKGKAKGKAKAQKKAKGDEEEDSGGEEDSLVKLHFVQVAKREKLLPGETPEEVWEKAIERGWKLEELGTQSGVEPYLESREIERLRDNSYSSALRDAMAPAEHMGRDQWHEEHEEKWKAIQENRFAIKKKPKRRKVHSYW